MKKLIAVLAALAAASAAAHHACHFRQFVVGGRTVFSDFTYEVQVAACQGVIHVHYYYICLLYTSPSPRD